MDQLNADRPVAGGTEENRISARGDGGNVCWCCVNEGPLTNRSRVGRPTFDYDNAAKMADNDVICGAVPGDADDCRGRDRPTGDVYCSSRRRRRWLRAGDVGSGRPLTTPDGTTTASCRRLNRVMAASTPRTPSTETMSTAVLPSERTLLAGVDPSCGTSHPLPNERLADTIWQSGAVGNSILRRSVSAVLRCRRRQYARSRRRRASISCAGGGGAASGLAASLLAAALLVGSVAADPRRLHGDSSHSAAAHSRELSPPESSKLRGSLRRPQSDDIGAGTPCIYEGHIKTDR